MSAGLLPVGRFLAVSFFAEASHLRENLAPGALEGVSAALLAMSALGVVLVRSVDEKVMLSAAEADASGRGW